MARARLVKIWRWKISYTTNSAKVVFLNPKGHKQGTSEAAPVPEARPIPLSAEHLIITNSLCDYLFECNYLPLPEFGLQDHLGLHCHHRDREEEEDWRRRFPASAPAEVLAGLKNRSGSHEPEEREPQRAPLH
ncbi:hypothetical protein GmHk_01G002788 [Glycine max]|nr:hypothetical protein GmHk_01G002788 [Glycine max]